MICLKQWKVGLRTIGLMSNGIVVIADHNEQFTLAISSPGVKALRDTLTEVLEDMERIKKATNDKEIVGT